MAPVEAGVIVRGRLTGFYDAATRFSGSTATLATVPAMVAMPSVDGTFEFASVPPGTYKLTFSGPEHIERTVTAQVMAGGANDLGVIDAVERTIGAFQFNLAMADEMLRLPVDIDGGGEVGTARWVTTPTVYVDLASLEPHQKPGVLPSHWQLSDAGRQAARYHQGCCGRQSTGTERRTAEADAR